MIITKSISVSFRAAALRAAVLHAALLADLVPATWQDLHNEYWQVDVHELLHDWVAVRVPPERHVRYQDRVPATGAHVSSFAAVPRQSRHLVYRRCHPA